MSTSLPKRTASLLRHVAARKRAEALVGFDGFVDTILHVVKTRTSATDYERCESMTEWAGRIAAASGVSANFEFVPQRVKLGGNGPIMANALLELGLGVRYIGTLGKPALHPVFADFGKRARVFSLAEPAQTDAIEFTDGKLMCSKLENLREANWGNLVRHIPEAKLVRLFAESDLIAMVNWTMLSELTGIFRNLLAHILPELTGSRRWIFFDLADPAKRSRADLRDVLRLIGRCEKHARVIFGMNLGEARQVSEVLGLGGVEETGADVARAASRIRDQLGIDTAVIHPMRFAAAADADGTAHVNGPLTLKPKITTGAGDNFNAGFCLGRIRDLGLAESLQTGVAASGYYVRSGKSPNIPALIRFLRSL
ncbi:MAG: PfkB family carbohydrate kinase [Chthoniobacteraceae bacterium]